MKKIHTILALTVLVVALGSCVESSSKYRKLEAERDSLAVIASNVTTDFETSLRTINEIEDALQTIRQAENIIMIENQEGNSDYAKAQIEAIDRTIQQNKAKIAELEKQLADAGSNSKQLNATINRLKEELKQKDTYINTLRAELDASKTQVADLSKQVDNLNQNVKDLHSNIEDLNAHNAEQEATIVQQAIELNTVYYIVAPKSTLKTQGIIVKGEIATPINKQLLIAADKRDLLHLPLNSRKVDILTKHPKNSYTLTKGDDKMYSLDIVDPEAFWNISNYLIISIK